MYTLRRFLNNRWTIFTIGVFVLCIPFAAWSADVIPLVPCDGALGNACKACDLVKLVQNILTWFLNVISILMMLVFAFGGLKMVMAGGDTGQVTEARHMMTNVVVGLVIVLSAWLIIDTVMKTFVKEGTLFGPWNEIKCVEPVKYTASPTGTVTATSTTPGPGCANIPALSPLTDKAAIDMENGETVVWDGADPQLQKCAEKFIRQVGGRVTSAYRPQSYQNHFLEIRDRWCTLDLKSNTSPECAAFKSEVAAEVSKHFGSSWNCGAVGQTSTHSSGKGVDISGVSNPSSAATLQAASASCLTWKNYPNDPYHYDLNPGCVCN